MRSGCAIASRDSALRRKPPTSPSFAGFAALSAHIALQVEAVQWSAWRRGQAKESKDVAARKAQVRHDSVALTLQLGRGGAQ